MSVAEYIDLSSDDETEATDIRDVKPCLLPSLENTRNRFANNEAPLGEHFIKHEEQQPDNLNFPNGVPNGSLMTSQARSHSNGFCSVSGTHGPSVPLSRQFWKSGDYEHGQAVGRISRNGQNRLRIHPKFLHSNATSHKWAFGAIAELLDNAVDEVQKGATFVSVDKFTNPRNGDPALLIQDDGGGMDPESLRRCMSFGFSDKQSNSTIGQYGNGFKTSSMRLGADAIVFTRCMNRRVLTQSVGILSYTFLRQTGSDDIVVPMVDYEFDTLTGTFRRLIRQDEKQFNSNLFALCKWSPFISEDDLLKQFNDMEHHGTKIVVFNLWFNDNGDMELDFESDQKDIIINGSQEKVKKLENNLTQRYISNRLQYSLRAYTSVLYLRLPKNFKVLLRGEVVQPHQIAKDLRYIACILYKPQVGGIVEGEVVTTIGYLEGCPNINVHGFNIYYRNRLILPFWRVASNSYGKGKGVVGVLETNFIKPTHDKQDFEKSTLFQKLESRLKEMTYEYWDYHCHLVGYTHSKHPAAKIPTADKVPRITRNGKGQVRMNLGSAASTKASEAQLRSSSRLSIGNQLLPALSDPTYQAPSHSIYKAGSQTGLSPQKRKYEMVHVSEMEPLKQALTVRNSDELDTRRYSSLERNVGEKQASNTRAMIQENKNLQLQCLEYEESEKKLLLKAEEVRSELLKAQLDYKKLLEELESLNEVKVEK